MEPAAVSFIQVQSSRFLPCSSVTLPPSALSAITVYSADIGPITAADDSKDDSKDDNKPTPVWPDHTTRPSHG